MLSKIKSNTEARLSALAAENGSRSGSDDEDAELINQDSNNNNNNNNNNSTSNVKNVKGERKRSEEELLDIVEVSRERRLSKDSADSLGNFIRWSFGHRLEQATPIQRNAAGKEDEEEAENMMASDEDEVEEMEEEEQAWSSRRQHQSIAALNKFHSLQSHPSERQHAKFSPTSGATNLTVAKTNLDPLGGRAVKRARTYMMDSPSPTGNVPARKTSSYLGNVVERLHQQQQQQQLQQHQQLQQQQQQVDLQESSSLETNLSQNLQRFLQQQTSLEDLCTQVGLEDNNNQLALAAAIHRALVDSVGQNASTSIDNKSTASSTGSSSGGSGSLNLSRTIQQASALSSSNNMNPRRAYNTRAAMHHHQPAPTVASLAAIAASQHQQQQPTSLGARVHAQHQHQQQQRHAQAAAALSALASVGSHLAAAVGNPHSHQHQHHHHPSFPVGGPLPGGAGGLGVDFECDTCGSSFDDRHRLMQHQSIHLELKKDWFNETPVDEVMKIFNRRRGEFLCNICNLRFEATLDYDQHNHQVHGPRPYCCQFCGNGTRTFKCWRQYLNHLYDHRYIFSCTIDDCDFTVNRRDSLRFHIFRFHLNCQLPQNQQTQPLRVNQHHPPPAGLAGRSKWAPMHGGDDADDLSIRGGDDLVNDEINVAD